METTAGTPAGEPEKRLRKERLGLDRPGREAERTDR
jgi:hypothetical protein